MFFCLIVILLCEAIVCFCGCFIWREPRGALTHLHFTFNPHSRTKHDDTRTRTDARTHEIRRRRRRTFSVSVGQPVGCRRTRRSRCRRPQWWTGPPPPPPIVSPQPLCVSPENERSGAGTATIMGTRGGSEAMESIMTTSSQVPPPHSCPPRGAPGGRGERFHRRHQLSPCKISTVVLTNSTARRSNQKSPLVRSCRSCCTAARRRM